MPRKRNCNKQKQMARKKQITTRLMIISLKVDKYIYKNKQITISQAQMYLEELTSFRSQCLGDAHSLQVCEKLTRCMRGIIEEQLSNDAVLEDTVTFKELNHFNNLSAASPVYSLADDDKTQMTSELLPDVQPENVKTYEIMNDNSNHYEGSKENNDVHTKSVRFFIADETKNINVLLQTIDDNPKINTDLDHEENSLNHNGQCNVDNELTNDIVDLTLNDIEQPTSIDKDLCSQSLLKTLEIEETLEPYTLPSAEHFINDTCGQDMVEFDREIINLLHPAAKDSTVQHNKDTVAHKITPIKQNTPVTIKTKTQSDLLNGTKTNKLIKNKSTKDVKIQKKRIINKKSKDNKPKTKQIINKTDYRISENDDNTLACNPLTNNAETALQDITNTTNKSTNEFNFSLKGNKDMEVGISNDPNIVPTPGTKKTPNAVQTVAQNIFTCTSSKTVCLEEDLSWMENIAYVREIHLDEYDPTLKPHSENFWENCDLPDKWDDRDFEWT